MTDAITRLDELLSDPMVQLVMQRDRVNPDGIRKMLERARRRAEKLIPPPAHVIAACRPQRGTCA